MKEQLNTLLPMPKKYHPKIANKIKSSNIVATERKGSLRYQAYDHHKGFKMSDFLLIVHYFYCTLEFRINMLHTICFLNWKSWAVLQRG